MILSAGLFSQKILLVENMNSFKHIKYYQGERIMIKYPGSDSRISDRIYDLTDTSIILVLIGEVAFADIPCIYRENWLVHILSGLSLVGGTAYFGIDTFNRLINNDSPVVLQETMMISGGLIAFGAALIPFRHRKINIGKKWRLRMIDLNEF